MVQSRHAELHCTCPLLGVKRTPLPDTCDKPGGYWGLLVTPLLIAFL